MIYSLSVIALIGAFILDAVIGDPYGFPHPVRFFGWMTDKGTAGFLKNELPAAVLVRRGAFVSILVTIVAFVLPACILILCFHVNIWLWFCVEIALCWTIFAAKSLRLESNKIYRTLKDGDIPLARTQLSMIVGRDTGELDETAITKAVVETVAENTSDGVTAPMIFACIGGAPLGLAYKAVNTLDSMIGYKNDKYLHFGRFAAKMDDVWNFVPARVTAFFMIIASVVLGLDRKNARLIYKRDRNNHASPNSAQTEAVCAGALGIQLAGPSSYFGKVVQKPTIGDKTREIQPEDILRTNRLMTTTSIIMLAVLSAVKLAIIYLVLGADLWNI